MRGEIAILLMVCACVGGLLGCTEPPRVGWLGYAETVPQQALRPEESGTLVPPALTTRPAAGEAVINVEVRFVSGPADLVVRHFALEGGEAARVIPPAQVAEAIAALRGSPHTRVLNAPRLALFSGQKGFATVQTQSAFVCDLRVRRGGSAPSFEPVLDAIPDGMRLTVSGRADGDAVVLTHVEGVQWRPLGLRECTARSARADQAGELNWQEAIVAEAATSVTNPCSIRLQKDQRLLLRMPQRAFQTVGNARLYARGSVVERIQGGGGPDGPAPAELETILIIGAGVRQ